MAGRVGASIVSLFIKKKKFFFNMPGVGWERDNRVESPGRRFRKEDWMSIAWGNGAKRLN